MKRIITLIAILICCQANFASAQKSTGTDFWVMFMDNYSTATLTLYISSEVNTSGNVSIPGLTFSQNFTTTAGNITAVTLPSSAEQTTTSIEDLGVHVTSNEDITVHGFNVVSATSDAFLAFPTDAIGTDYLTLAYRGLTNDLPSELGFVAAEPGTTNIAVILSTNANGNAAGSTINVSLTQGQTYQVKATTALGDLTGTRITSDKKIAVFAGAQCTNVPNNAYACDHLVEQLPPLSAWGLEFVTIPLKTRLNGDTYRVLAQTNGTVVQLDGTAWISLNAGEFHEQILAGPHVITSNEPLLVGQYSNGTGYDNVVSDPFFALVPPSDQFLPNSFFNSGTPNIPNNYVNIVTETAFTTFVMLDGVTIPAIEWSVIPGSSFSGASLDVAVGQHSVTSSFPTGVLAYGFGNADSYGYLGSQSFSPVATVFALDLTPATQSVEQCDQVCVEATVTDQFTDPVVGVKVDFDVTGATTASGFGNTDALGKVTFCYDPDGGGSDNIVATIASLSETVMATILPNTMSLTPSSQNVSLGGQVCVMAEILDNASNPVVNEPIVFVASGVNSATATVNTDILGQAQFCYIGTNFGTDNIEAEACSITQTATAEIVSCTQAVTGCVNDIAIDVASCTAIEAAKTDAADVFIYEACGAVVTMDVSTEPTYDACEELNFTRTYTLYFDGVAQSLTCDQTVMRAGATISVDCPLDVVFDECDGEGDVTLISIAATRTGNDYSLDGNYLSDHLPPKLLNVDNFGITGTVANPINITHEASPITASILADHNLMYISYILDGKFSAAELIAMETWVNEGGSMIITADDNNHDDVAEHFGYPSTSGGVGTYEPEVGQESHSIFSGPFGTITSFNAAGTLGYFPTTTGATILARDTDGNATILEKQVGLGHIILIGDICTHSFETLTIGDLVTNDNDKFISNLFAYATEGLGSSLDDSYANWLAGFTTTGGCNTTSTDLSSFETPPDACSDVDIVVTIDYEATDDCGTVTCSSSFTFKAQPALSVTCGIDPNVTGCNTEQDILDAYDAWLAGFSYSDGCNAEVTSTAPALPVYVCGAAIDLTYTYVVEDDCITAECTSTFTVAGGTEEEEINCPTDVSGSVCDYANQAALDQAYADWLADFMVTDAGCGDGVGGFTTTPPTSIDYCAGDTITLTYEYDDGCLGGSNSGFVAASWNDQSVYLLDTDLNSVSSFPAGATNPNGIASDGSTIYTVHFSTLEVYAYDYLGNVLFSWNSPSLNNAQGACLVDGELAIATSGEIRYFNPATGVLNNVITHSMGGVEGITYDGAELWLLGNTGIISINPTTGATIQTIANAASICSFSGTGIAMDGADHIILACTNGDWYKVLLVDGSVVASGNNGVDVFGLAGGVSGGNSNSVSCTVSFAVSKAEQVAVICPSDVYASACDYADGAEINQAYTDWLALFGVTSTGCGDGLGDFTTVPPAANFDYCLGDTITLTYIYIDGCTTAECTATFGIAAPAEVAVSCPGDVDVSTCDFPDPESLQMAYQDWLAGFEVIEAGCGDGIGKNDPPPSSIDFCAGDTVTIVFSYFDACSSATCTATFMASSATEVELSCPSFIDGSVCDYADQAALSAAYQSWLDQFVVVEAGCGDGIPTYSGNVPTFIDYCLGDTVIIDINYTDGCSTDACKSTFAIARAESVAISCPEDVDFSVCVYTDQAELSAAYATWLAGFTVTEAGCGDGNGYFDVSPPSDIDYCLGATVSLTYTYSDGCTEASCTKTFTITAGEQVSVSCPGMIDVNACDYVDQAALDIAYQDWLDQFVVVEAGCGDGTGTFNITPPASINYCAGDTVILMFSYSDGCTEASCTKTFAIAHPEVVAVSCPDDYAGSVCDFADEAALNAAYDAWFAQFGVANGGCGNGEGSFTTFPVFEIDYCLGDTITLTYSYTDGCTIAACTATFAVAVGEAVAVLCPIDVDASVCDYADQAAIDVAYQDWLAGFSVTEAGCGDGLGMFTTIPPASIDYCAGDTITLTYSYADECTTAECTSTFAIAIGDVVTVTCPADEDLEVCDFSDQASITQAYQAWLASFGVTGVGCGDGIGGFTTVPPVTIGYCEGDTVTLTYRYTDGCTTSECTATYGLAKGPEVEVACPNDETYSSCDFADQAALNLAYDAWVAQFISVEDGCGGFCGFLVDPPLFVDLCLGDTITLTYRCQDICSDDPLSNPLPNALVCSEDECTATFIVSAADAVKVACPAEVAVSVCDYADQASLDQAYADWLAGFSVTESGCGDGIGSFDVTPPVSIDYCLGDTITLTFSYTDGCTNASCTQTFAIAKGEEVAVSCPVDVDESVCNYADQAALDLAYANWLAGFVVTEAGCGIGEGLFDVSPPAFIDICMGDTITLTFSYDDGCTNAMCTSTFALAKGEDAAVACPSDVAATVCDYTDQAALDLAYADWLAGFSVTEAGCGDGNGSFTTTPPASIDYCAGDTITLTYEYSDGCGGSDPVSSYIIGAWNDEKVHFLDDSFNSVNSFSVPSNPNAIATDGNYIYTGHFGPTEIIVSDYAGVQVNQLSVSYTPRGMDFVNGSLVVENNGDFHYYDPATLVFQFTVSSGISGFEGICFDGTSIWALGNTGIVELDPNTGAQLSTLPNAATICSYNGTGLGYLPSGDFVLGCVSGDWFIVSGVDGSVISSGNNGYEMGGIKAAVGGSSAASCTATFAVAKAEEVVISCPDDVEESSCDYVDQASLDFAYSNWIAGFVVTEAGCGDGVGAFTTVAPLTIELCQGDTVTLTFVYDDGCTNASCTKTFAIAKNQEIPVLTCPENTFLGSNPLDVDNDGIPDVIPTGVPYVDGCGETGTTTDYSDVLDLEGCQHSLIRTFKRVDACGLEAECTVIWTWMINISLEVQVQDLSCSGFGDGSITVIASPLSQAPFSYAWSNGASTQSIDNLSAGTYSVTVTTEEGCEAVADGIIVIEPELLDAEESAVLLNCFGDSNGQIFLTVSGGTPWDPDGIPNNGDEYYLYDWYGDGNNGGGSTVYDQVGDFDDDMNPSGLSAGTYICVIIDANLCNTEVTAVISEPAELLISSITPSIDCSGVAPYTGSIDITYTGGFGPKTFEWVDGNNNIVSTDEDPTGLPEGSYTVTITDANGCTAVESASLGCNECVDILYVSQADIDAVGNTPTIFAANVEVYSDAVIAAGQDITFSAGSLITLLVEFEDKLGSRFTTEFVSCSDLQGGESNK